MFKITQENNLINIYDRNRLLFTDDVENICIQKKINGVNIFFQNFFIDIDFLYENKVHIIIYIQEAVNKFVCYTTEIDDETLLFINGGILIDNLFL